MYKILILAFLVFSFFDMHLNASVEKPIVIVIASYNNKDWYKLNLQSVLTQNYENYRIIYINDASSDDTGKLVEKYLKKHKIDYRAITFDDSFSEDITVVTEKFSNMVNESPQFFILVNNVNRAGALANYYRSIQSCQDNEIIAMVDGDDRLYEALVLEKLNKVYVSKNVWLTHGHMIEFPSGLTHWCEPIPNAIIANNAFRESKCPTHLRTFYAWLFKKIQLDDLLYEGKFFPMTGDMAIMFPMIEMCGERHVFIEKINYIYNMVNQLNDNKVNAQLQRDLDKYIRNLPRYQRLQDKHEI